MITVRSVIVWLKNVFSSSQVMQTMWTSIPVEPALLLPVLTTLLRFGTSDPIRCYNTTKVKKCNLHHIKAHFYLKLFVLASVRSRPVDLEWAVCLWWCWLHKAAHLCIHSLVKLDFSTQDLHWRISWAGPNCTKSHTALCLAFNNTHVQINTQTDKRFVHLLDGLGERLNEKPHLPWRLTIYFFAKALGLFSPVEWLFQIAIICWITTTVKEAAVSSMVSPFPNPTGEVYVVIQSHHPIC